MPSDPFSRQFLISLFDFYSRVFSSSSSTAMRGARPLGWSPPQKEDANAATHVDRVCDMPCMEELEWMVEAASHSLPQLSSVDGIRLLDLAEQVKTCLQHKQDHYQGSGEVFTEKEFECKAIASHVCWQYRMKTGAIDDRCDPAPQDEPINQMRLLRRMASTPEDHVAVENVAASAIQSLLRRRRANKEPDILPMQQQAAYSAHGCMGMASSEYRESDDPFNVDEDETYGSITL